MTLRRVGAHKITVGAKTAGFTKGNLNLTITADKRTITVAEYGTTPADIEVTGVHCKVDWQMVERSLKTLDIALNGIYPLNYLTATTSRGIGRSGIQTAQTLVGQGGPAGRGLQITLHPISRSSTDATQDIVLYNAIVVPTGNLMLDDQGDMVQSVEAECVVSTAQADGSLLALINDPNVGV